MMINSGMNDRAVISIYNEFTSASLLCNRAVTFTGQRQVTLSNPLSHRNRQHGFHEEKGQKRAETAHHTDVYALNVRNQGVSAFRKLLVLAHPYATCHFLI